MRKYFFYSERRHIAAASAYQLQVLRVSRRYLHEYFSSSPVHIARCSWELSIATAAFFRHRCGLKILILGIGINSN